MTQIIQLLGESILVGIYTAAICAICSPIIPFPFLLFVVGFLKHILGYYLYIHEYYCKLNGSFILPYKEIVFDSIIEGVAFGFIGIICYLFGITMNVVYIAFFIGSGLHLSMDWFGIHRRWRRKHCKQ